MQKVIGLALLLWTSTARSQKGDSLILTRDTNIFKTVISTRYALQKIRTINEKVRSLKIPSILIMYGFLALENDNLKTLNSSIKNEMREDHPSFRTKIDDYLQFAPALTVYGLNAMGIKGRNNFRDRTMIYLLSNMILTTTVFSVKKLSYQLRPDGTNYYSFPSGHTAEAFASAELLYQEYKNVSPWYGMAGYAMAAATGYLRMYNNKHWLSDVIAGAGIGILSTKAAYWIYPIIKRNFFKDKPMSTLILPRYQNGTAGISLIYCFTH
jgi:hypothetical protein